MPFGPPIVLQDEREHHFGWTFFVLKGDGTGRFEPLAPTVPRPFVLSAIPHSLVLGDFDGEGRVDGVIATFADPGIIRLRNDGTGQFALDPPIGQAARYLQATDINRDGLPELVCLVDDRTIGVYLRYSRVVRLQRVGGGIDPTYTAPAGGPLAKGRQ
jgi:hypothetical protein